MKRACYLIIPVIVLMMFLSVTSRAQAVNESDTLIVAQEKVRIIRNIQYAPQPGGVYGGDSTSDRSLDLYLPENTEEAVPAILFIHGGGFSGGDKFSTRLLCEKLCEQGFGVVSINYRLYLRHHKITGASASANLSGGLPDSAKFHPELQKAIETASEDAYAALNWVIQNASHYNIDSSKVAVSGGSAGAMTALYSAYVNPVFGGKIKAVVNLWGGLADERKIRPHSPPVLTYHGDKDKLIHLDYAHALHKRMKETGDTQSQLFVLENMGHALYKYITSDRCGEIAGFLNKVFAEP